MPSLRAQFLKWYLKANFKRHPLHLMPPEKLRAGAEAVAPSKPPAGVSIEMISGAEIKGEWHRYVDATPGRVLLYFHGGGYGFGSAKSHRAATFALARYCRANVFSLDYRLAPEDPFPAAVEDALIAYRSLLAKGYDNKNIVIAGDSAGGGLAMALLLACKEHKVTLPTATVLFSPWTDMATSGQSLDINEKSDAMFKKVYIVEGAKKYLAGADPKSPLASPIYGALEGLPPILTFVSDDEVLRDDSLRLHDRLIDAGVKSELVIEKGLAHVWPIFHGKLPEAATTLKQAAAFFETHWQGAS